MRERDDLAGGAADPGGHDRVPAVVQPVGDEPAQVRADAGVAAEEAGQAQQHRAADDGLGQRRAGAGGAAGQDRPLKRGLIVGRHRAVGQVAEPGGDAVGARAGLQVGQQRVAAALNRAEQRGRRGRRARARTRSGGRARGRADRGARAVSRDLQTPNAT